MSKDAASWARYGRRFIMRLSLKRADERAILDEYDRRSQLLGTEDKDFLHACLIAGFRVLTGRVPGGVEVNAPGTPTALPPVLPVLPGQGAAGAGPAVDHIDRAIAQARGETAGAGQPEPSSAAPIFESHPTVPTRDTPHNPESASPAPDGTQATQAKPAVSSSKLLGGLMKHS